VFKRGNDGDEGDCFGKRVANLHSANSESAQRHGETRISSKVPARQLVQNLAAR
jgi:hypothetical protein